MKKYEKPAVLVERFSLSESLANCSTYRVNFMDAQCVLSRMDSLPQPMVDLAASGYFMSGDGCLPDHTPTDGAVCYFTSTNMAFTS